MTPLRELALADGDSSSSVDDKRGVVHPSRLGAAAGRPRRFWRDGRERHLTVSARVNLAQKRNWFRKKKNRSGGGRVAFQAGRSHLDPTSRRRLIGRGRWARAMGSKFEHNWSGVGPTSCLGFLRCFLKSYPFRKYYCTT